MLYPILIAFSIFEVLIKYRISGTSVLAVVSYGPITWRISAHLAGLRFQLGFLNKSS